MIELRPCAVCFVAEIREGGVSLFDAANQMQEDIEGADRQVAERLSVETNRINQMDCVGGVCPRITEFHQALGKLGAYNLLPDQHTEE